MAKLRGKVAVVTGASKGIGAAIAEKLGTEGASVVVNYASDRAGAERVVKNIVAAGAKAIAVQSDVSRQSDIDKLFSETVKAFGKVDILGSTLGAACIGGSAAMVGDPSTNPPGGGFRWPPRPRRCSGR